jgi:hypothetical protein
MGNILVYVNNFGNIGCDWNAFAATRGWARIIGGDMENQN